MGWDWQVRASETEWAVQSKASRGEGGVVAVVVVVVVVPPPLQQNTEGTVQMALGPGPLRGPSKDRTES